MLHGFRAQAVFSSLCLHINTPPPQPTLHSYFLLPPFPPGRSTAVETQQHLVF